MVNVQTFLLERAKINVMGTANQVCAYGIKMADFTWFSSKTGERRTEPPALRRWNTKYIISAYLHFELRARGFGEDKG